MRIQSASGHIVSEQGISSLETKVQVIRAAPKPTNMTDLKAYLGLLNYYERFLPNFSGTLPPLYALLFKNRPWKQRSKKRTAFQKGKQKFLESEFLTRYDLQRSVSLSCDASRYGVAACLTHIMSDGEKRPIAFASRTLSTAEKKYTQLEKEALALVYGLKQFYKYLVARECTLFTDHRPLLKILGPYESGPNFCSNSVTTMGTASKCIQLQAEVQVRSRQQGSRFVVLIANTYICK